jgi:O-antigen/teichoic acid export membrane protein
LLTVYHAPPLTLVLAIVFIGIFTLTVNKIIVKNKSPWIVYGFDNFSAQIIKEQTPIAISFLSFPITQALSIQGAIILVGYLLGPSYVVILSTTRTFMNVIKQVVSVANASIWPELTTAYGQDNILKFKTIFIRAVQIVVVIVIGFNLSVFLIGKPIYLFWTKNKLVFNNLFFYPFALTTSISAIWNIFGMVQGATNRTKKYAIYNLCSAAILLAGIIIMAKFLGLEGVLTAMFLSEVFMLYFVTKDSLDILQITSFTNFKLSFFKFNQKSTVS